jgi:5'-3' exonuclease
MSPDKDLAQCVREDGRVVAYDRRHERTIDAEAVRAKFGVDPQSIPDWLALVGDAADGFPGLPGWGARSASAVLARYGHLEAIPARARAWDLALRNADRLAETVQARRAEALLYRELATLRTDVPITESLDDLAWRGVPRGPFEALVAALAAPHLRARVPRWTEA